MPQAFEMRTRSRLPPILTRGIIRSVWLLKAAPSAGAGAAVQVPTQWVLSAMGPPRELTGSPDYEMTRRRLQGRRRRSAMSENCQDLDCLTGIRVVDFTQFEAGPSCTEALAWLGAEVVKIENPKTGDPARRVVPGKAPDDPWYFHMFNANKKSLAIDLKSPRGVHLVKELLKKADITVENMAPGTIDRLGLGYDEVRKLNPRIIYCSIQGFGAGSKYEKGLAFDMIAQAAGGMISVTGEADRPPVKPGPSFGDTGTGMLMAVTILGALLERQRTGKGRRLQVAMQDAMLHYMRTCFAVQARTGKATPRRGGKTVMGTNAPSGLYQCKPYGSNDWIYITTSRGNPEHWGRLMKLIGREELIDDPRFATGAARVEREAEVDAIITEWTRKHTKEEAMTLISGVGVPAGAVFDTMELQNDPSFEKRGIMQVMEHPNGPFKMPTWPVRVDGKPPRLTPSPLLGQHNAEVLNAWLGMGADDVAALKSDGVL
ncbi:MAG: formyl-CoA transferase [Candidatus Rokuibacteriota bacterium]|nr:MAG: formyl-CoA transferase [Candidatus Rokubacteria bacterium]